MADIDLKGKVAIITGGGGGMGRIMSLGLIKRGAKVAAVDVNADAAKATADEGNRISNAGSAIAIAADITKPEECERVVAQVVRELGGVHMLVNNAGIGMQTINENYMNAPVRFWEAEPDRWQRMVDVNFKAPYLMARAVAPHMIRQKWGRIVNVTTSLDTMIRGAYTPYGQTKAALEAATATWAKDLKDTGVTVNVLVPGGPTNTGFIPSSAPFDRAKLVQPTVMEGPIVWLASDLSNGITDCRFVGQAWDTSLPPDEAAKKVCAPAAWPNMGIQAAWPGA
ncbi:MAG: SDR family NAD(P)-dependent oxidoreductase [Rhodospirillales bacterium]